MNKRILLSSAILLASLGLAYAPLPGTQQTLVIVSGSELQEPLAVLSERFEQENPAIRLTVAIQGSQDIVNNYLDDRNDFDPAVLIPANGELLGELRDRWQTQFGDSPFYGELQPVAKTRLVAVAWPDRGKVLFPSGQFQWSRLETALAQSTWQSIGGKAEWGSFDLIMTDPDRSNSGQLTLSLWAQSEINRDRLDAASLNQPAVEALFSLVKKSVYQPPRSTDVLLQEFIARGPNDADIATVYESIALYRWQQANTTQRQPYQIYYLDPTIETVSTAAIASRNISRGQAKAAQSFVDFLTQPEQQAVFVQFGFRPVNPAVDLQTVPNSPWSQNIPGAEIDPAEEVVPLPDRDTLNEVIRLWQRAS
ncbi:MAG: ABC transporter substrate-binding protein [Leptolyngbyaceae cyanobacterium SL_1_1]|nr:ABC transporter substrate-binding protein [Leptolyngbyaceae cyanobacterium RM1_1_2]NJO11116.1 ABC transporter substrate-binding protein [Leptolyngbyaceae cyanobacterium SL_1_1]